MKIFLNCWIDIKGKSYKGSIHRDVVFFDNSGLLWILSLQYLMLHNFGSWQKCFVKRLRKWVFLRNKYKEVSEQNKSSKLRLYC